MTVDYIGSKPMGLWPEQEGMKHARASDSETDARVAQCAPARATYMPHATAIQGKAR
jgi:hypothetical protein